MRGTLPGAKLLGVLALGVITSPGGTTAHAQYGKKPPDGGVTRPFRGELDNDFTATAPAPLLTLDDFGGGDATGLGKVTDRFTVVIDFTQPIGDGFFFVSKTGSLVAANGDRVDLEMVGTFEAATFDVHYVFMVTGGTGRFAGASGSGTWHVPPPDSFDPTTGSGSGGETFEGTITLPRGN